jgi:hypothetical protein
MRGLILDISLAISRAGIGTKADSEALALYYYIYCSPKT